MENGDRKRCKSNSEKYDMRDQILLENGLYFLADHRNRKTWNGSESKVHKNERNYSTEREQGVY